MADYTVAAADNGAYELELTANTLATVLVKAGSSDSVVVTVHNSDSPVYARLGTSVQVKNPNALQITDGTWGEIYTGITDNNTIALISAGAATVSVSRS